MLGLVDHNGPREFEMPFEPDQIEAATPELALLARQTRALEYIAVQLAALRAGQPIELPLELQPDFEIARKRLLEEAPANGFIASTQLKRR